MTADRFDELIAEIEADPVRAEQEAEWKPSRDVALLLVGARLRLGLSQTEFAKRAGVSQSYVAQLESGTANPSIRRLSSILRKNGLALDLSLVPIESTSASSVDSGVSSVEARLRHIDPAAAKPRAS